MTKNDNDKQRVTVFIRPELVRAAKAYAAKQNMPLSELVSIVLKAKLPPAIGLDIEVGDVQH